MSPGQVMGAYGVLCLVLLLIGLGFALQGLWPVFVFALIDILALLLALLHYARHATDHEHIALGEHGLLIERIEAGAVHQVRLDPCWTRIHARTAPRMRIELEARGVKVEVGVFVSEEARQDLVCELRGALKARSLLS